jgi:hypothetical protein
MHQLKVLSANGYGASVLEYLILGVNSPASLVFGFSTTNLSNKGKYLTP